MESGVCRHDLMDCDSFGQDGIYFVEKIFRVIRRAVVRQVKVCKIVYCIDPCVRSPGSGDGGSGSVGRSTPHKMVKCPPGSVMLIEKKVRSNKLVGNMNYAVYAASRSLSEWEVEEYCPWGRHLLNRGNFLSLDGRVVSYPTMFWPIPNLGLAAFKMETWVFIGIQ